MLRTSSRRGRGRGLPPPGPPPHGDPTLPWPDHLTPRPDSPRAGNECAGAVAAGPVHGMSSNCLLNVPRSDLLSSFFVGFGRALIWGRGTVVTFNITPGNRGGCIMDEVLRIRPDWRTGWHSGLLSAGRLGIVVAAVVSLGTGCSKDPLAIRCQEYVQRDSATQLDLAARWGSPNRSHPSPLGQLVADSYRSQLVSYCRVNIHRVRGVFRLVAWRDGRGPWRHPVVVGWLERSGGGGECGRPGSVEDGVA